MNTTYPKRLLHFISISTLCLCLLGIAKQIGILLNNITNISSIDKQSTALTFLIEICVIICCIGVFKKKSWSWIGMTSYLIYSLGVSIYDGFHFGFEDELFIITIPFLLALLTAIIFLFIDDVANYLKVSAFHKILAVIIPIGVYLTLSRDSNPNVEKINYYYIDVIDNKWYLHDEPYTGKVYSNHQNGNIEFEGYVNNGKMEGEWTNFHDNGTIENTVFYIDGKENGKVLTYFSNGVLKEERNYISGKLEGDYKLWYDEDQLEISGSFKDHKINGEWKYYYSEVIKVEVYEMDSLIKTEYLDIENTTENY